MRTRTALAVLVAACTCGVTTAQHAGSASLPDSPQASFSWADTDGDGLEDAFVITTTAKARLLRNQGDGTLVDITEQAGLSGIVLPRLALWEDFDLDGDVDLYVGTLRGPRLFAGVGGGAFQEITEHAGLAHLGTDQHAGWFDYDQDGLPDLHVRTADENLLYRNLGEGAFASVELGLEAPLVETGAGAPAAVALEGTTGAKAADTATTEEPEVDRTAATASGRKLVMTPTAPAEVGDPMAVSLPPGSSLDAQAIAWCARFIRDQATGDCLTASTVPAFGALCPLGPNFFIDAPTGYVGMGTLTPSEKLDVLGRIHASETAHGWTIKGEWSLDPTRGYLGIQGQDNFDGIPSADWPGFEIGAAGLSVGAATFDNFGVMGHSNGVGVRGEFSGNPSADFGELGLDGIGVRASGTGLAGEFLGDVSLIGTDADLEIQDGDGDTAAIIGGSSDGLDNKYQLYRDGVVSIESSTGSYGLQTRYWRTVGGNSPTLIGGTSNADAAGFLNLYDETGIPVVLLDADDDNLLNGVSEGMLTIRSRGTSGTGGQLILQDNLGVPTLTARGGGNTEGSILEMFNSTLFETIELDGQQSEGSGFITVRNQLGQSTVLLDGNGGNDSGSLLLVTGGNATNLFLDSYGPSGGGLVSVRNDNASKTIELVGDNGADSGQINVYNRFGTNFFPGVYIQGRDSGGTGGEVLVRDGDGTTTINLDGDISGVGDLRIQETDGSLAMWFGSNTLSLLDSGGTARCVFNRQTGAKSAVADTPTYGQRLFYAEESSEVWFTDYGTGRLRNGAARIALDPVFLESVTISDQHPMRVFVTLTDDCKGVFVKKGFDHFVVRELDGGQSNASFDFRVVAKHKGLEGARLEPFALPEAVEPDTVEVPTSPEGEYLEDLPAPQRAPGHDPDRKPDVTP